MTPAAVDDNTYSWVPIPLNAGAYRTFLSHVAAGDVYRNTNYQLQDSIQAEHFRKWTSDHSIYGAEIRSKYWYLKESSIYALGRFIDNKWSDNTSNTKRMLANLKGKEYARLQSNTKGALM